MSKPVNDKPLPPAPDEDARKQFSGRLLVLKLGLLLFFAVIAARLVKIQIIDAPKFQAIARKQYEQKFALPAVRGDIYDRNGNVLVSNTMFVSFAADPKIIGDKAEIVASAFSRAFGRPKAQYLARLRERDRRFVWLERRVRPDLARRVEAEDLEGVVTIKEPKRLYHYDDLASSLIGFTNIDNSGIAGIELEYDGDLSGTPGSITMQRDGLGRTRPSADYPYVPPQDGHDLVLTINLTYQAIVEEELKKGVALNKADGGLAVMLNPKTGEILALATEPGINPNEYFKFQPGSDKNRVVTDMFEPGSVFKIVTASAAYEHHIIAPTKRFNAEHGVFPVVIRGRVIRTIRDSHENDFLTFQEAMEQSSNIVMAKAGELIGAENFYRQARDFGFGIPTGVDLPGEVRGRLKKPQEWSGITLQTMAYGYEVAVTPLQIAAAYAAVANNGVLMRPYAVERIKDKDGTVLEEQQPQKIRTVISAGTDTLVTRALEGVVLRGTGRDVAIDGIRIAGKTGTAKRIVDGRYAQQYTASFVGFFPVEDPQIVCLVMLDNPQAHSYYGGSTSGPVFRAIAQRIIHTSWKFTEPPQQSPQPDENVITVPDVRNVKVAIAEKILEGRELKTRNFGTGDIVVRQSPEPGSKAERGDVVKLALNSGESPDQQGLVMVPDVRGTSIRRAMNRLTVDDFDVDIEGSGVIVRQSPAPGRRVSQGATVRLACEPRPLSTAVLY